MNSNYYIYFHKKKTTGEIFYVGQTKSIARTKSIYGRNKLWRKLVAEFGFTIEIVHSNLSKQEANELEQHYIQKFGRMRAGGILSNCTIGGDAGSNLTFSKETRLKMSESHKGEKNSRFGKPCPENVRLAVSNRMKGHKKSQLQKEVAAHVCRTRIRTEEERQKLRQSKLGKKRPQSVIDAIKKAQSLPIIGIQECAIVEFDSLTQAARILGIDRSTVADKIRKGTPIQGFRYQYL